MIINHFKIAIRNLNRRKIHAFINIGGLAVGIAVCLLIFIVIQFDLSFDNYHNKKDRIYRVLTEYHHAEPEIFYGKGVPYALPRAIKNSIPQIETSATVVRDRDTQIIVLDQSGQHSNMYKEKTGVYFTEPAIFEIFDIDWLVGNAASLKDPNTVVLSREMAVKYFGNWEDALGKQIKWNNEEVLEVTGVLDDIPPNSELQFQIVIAFGTAHTSNMYTSDNWDGTSGSHGSFVLLKENVKEAQVTAQLRKLAEENKTQEVKDSHVLQPLNAIHFDATVGNFNGKTTSKNLINVLWIIAGFILLISCVNFINLSTAQAVDRFKEIGVRKVLGSNNNQLKAQFLTETFLIVVIAELLALGIVAISLEFFGGLMDMPLAFSDLNSLIVTGFLLIIAVLVTFLAGFYPSIVLSRGKAIEVLAKKMSWKNAEGISMRRSLVVFQFVIAQTLIFGTIILLKQMDYFTNQSMGYNKTAILNIPIPTDSLSLTKVDFIREQLKALNEIKNVSFSSNSPTEARGTNNWAKLTFDNRPQETDFFAIAKGVDHNYLHAYELPLIGGRSFKSSTNSYEFLVNELFMQQLGYSDPLEILDKELHFYGDLRGPIVGVVNNFNDRSFKDAASPVFMFNSPDWYAIAGVKLATSNIESTISGIEKLWNATFPDYVFEYEFLDDKIAAFYAQERKLSELYKIAALIAIILSCLGLYGLASFMVNKRLKEAGIRKVLGATLGNIVYLFSKEFVVLITIAFCIAAPLAWYFMGKWLQEYAYHIEIDWLIFAGGGLAALCIALTTVSFQAIRAARANPVQSLRME